jgi:AcrR family transcriptional regulator
VSTVPRSPHRTLRDEVAASQRGRLLVAMSEVVGEKGYAAATVADVLERAGVSRRTFYEHFADKEACFLAAYDHGVDSMLEAVSGELADLDGDDPRAAIETAIRAFLELLAAEPGFARAFLIEVWAAGPAALERHSQVIERFHALMRAVPDQARAIDRSLPPVSDTTIAAITGGISRVATIEILAGRAEQLPRLADDLAEFAGRAGGL